MPDEAAKRPSRFRDAALWAEAVRGVAPLRRRASGAPRLQPAPLGKPEGGADASSPPPAVSEAFGGPDRATAARLKRGLYKIEARLDLHGMTQVEAHCALLEFVRVSREAGRRCVLLVTGRGLGREAPGILKTAVPRWLAESELRQHMLGVAAAQPRHGGTGALYLLLRRRR